MKRPRRFRSAVLEPLECRCVPSAGGAAMNRVLARLNAADAVLNKAFASLSTGLSQVVQSYESGSISAATLQAQAGKGVTLLNQAVDQSVAGMIRGGVRATPLIDKTLSGSPSSLLTNIQGLIAVAIGSSSTSSTGSTSTGSTSTSTSTSGSPTALTNTQFSTLFNRAATDAIESARLMVISDFNGFVILRTRLGARGTRMILDELYQANSGSAATTPVTSGQTGTTTGTTTGGNTIGSVTVTPALPQGTHFQTTTLNRSNITTDSSTGTAVTGTPLTLTLNVYDVSASTGAVTPMNGATVNVWQPNAAGVYSGESASSTTGQDFLRGYQVTSASGSVTFQTIVPGWTTGSAPHINFMITTTSASGATTNVLTSQLFFDQTFMNTLYASTTPYSTRGVADTTNAKDTVYNTPTASGAVAGSFLTINPVPTGSGGYAASYNVYIETT